MRKSKRYRTPDQWIPFNVNVWGLILLDESKKQTKEQNYLEKELFGEILVMEKTWFIYFLFFYSVSLTHSMLFQV